MKSLYLGQIEQLAEECGAVYFPDGTVDGLPSIEWEQGDYGFYATEEHNGKYYGWVYFGLAANQSLPQVMQCMNALTTSGGSGELLTVERARELMGKRIEVSYSDVNSGTERFRIVGISEQPSTSIGQTKEYRLHTVPIDANGKELPVSYSPQYFHNGKEIHPTNRHFVINGELIDVKSYGTKRDLDLTCLAKYLKKASVLTKDGKAITEIKCYPCNINTGWWGVAWIMLDDSERVKISYMGKELFDLFNIQRYNNKPDNVEWLDFEIKQASFETWCYEWQGIFRRGSGAEKLYIDKIYD